MLSHLIVIVERGIRIREEGMRRCIMTARGRNQCEESIVSLRISYSTSVSYNIVHMIAYSGCSEPVQVLNKKQAR